MGNALPRTINIDATTRRRLGGIFYAEGYDPSWIGTRYLFFGGHNYGYLFGRSGDPVADKQIIAYVNDMTITGFTVFGLEALSIWLANGYLFTMLALSFAYEELMAQSDQWLDPVTKQRQLSGISGVTGILAGYLMGKTGIIGWDHWFPWNRKTLGFLMSHFVLGADVYMYFRDETFAGETAHGVHFRTLLVGFLLAKYIF